MMVVNSGTIAIVDYGMGNLASVSNALGYLGIDSIVTRSAEDLQKADGIILPGVGAFGEAMINLRSLDLVVPLTDLVVDQRKPFLGICLGMQLLVEHSNELGEHEGLGWIPGGVERLPAEPDVSVPHVGWASLEEACVDPLLTGIKDGACFYFDHSYRVVCRDLKPVAKVYSGVPIAAIMRRGNIAATQFHPEKSQRSGLRLLRNFSNACMANP